MRHFTVLLCVTLLSSCAEAPKQSEAASQNRAPNILLIVADDLGFTDLGAFGGEIETPHLDRLARSGIRLANFRAGPSCAPTRAMLMTGTDNHLAGMGSQSGLETELQSQYPAYQNKLAKDVPTIAERLKALGYRPLASAKWHLGHSAEYLPNARGFERSLVLLEGGAGHFDDTPLFAHYNASWLQDDVAIELPDNFYSTDFMTDKMITFLEETPTDTPYFAYLGYTAPHWPLQAPAADMAKYKGQYKDGWHALHAARLQGAKTEGVIAQTNPGVAYEPGMKDWSDLTDEQKLVEQAKMEAYAAMVDRVDQNIGRLMAYLDRRGDLDNTAIFFMADNGAEAHVMEAIARNVDWVRDNFDNSAESIGTKNSYVTLGASWARATAAPFRDSKSKMAEGGIRVPAFIKMPGVKTGVDTSFMRVMDLAPTFVELAGGSQPTGVMGRSLVPRWQQGTPVYAADEVIAGETYNRRYVYKGDWKLLYQEPPFGTGQWELYNLNQDVGEQENLVTEHPQLVAELIDAYNQYAQAVGVVEPEEPIYY